MCDKAISMSSLKSDSDIFYGYTIIRLLTNGYLRKVCERYIYAAKELIDLITNYYLQIAPIFNIYHQSYSEESKQSTVKIEFDDNDNSIIFCAMPMINEYFEKEVYFQTSTMKAIKSDLKRFTAMTINSWNKQDLIDIMKTDNEYDYIYKFEMVIKKGCPSFGIGIISSNDIEYKNGYWICIENVIAKSSESWVYCKRIEDYQSDKQYQYQHGKRRDDIICNIKKIPTPKIGDTLSLTLNYITNEIQLFHNDTKMNTFFYINELENIPFHPVFHVIPNLVRQRNNDDEKEKLDTSTLKIISCYLDKVEKNYIKFDDYILDIERKDNVCSQIIKEYGNSDNNEYLFDQWLCLKILGVELTGYKQYVLMKERQNFHADILQNEGEILFNLLWNGYYANLINLSHFDESLKNLMNVADELFDRARVKHLETEERMSQHEFYYDGSDDWLDLSRFKHIAIIICHVWICIEMYQYFKNELLKPLIYNTLYQQNNYFKDNENNSNLITNIIIDLMFQNFDEFEECFRNNDDFNQRISKIYMITHSMYIQRSFLLPLVFVNKWIDNHVLPKLNMSTNGYMIYEKHIGQQFYYSGRRRFYNWKHDYFTKETIEYHPSINKYGEDIKSDEQKDWLCNPLMLSRELGSLLIYGFIRRLFHQYMCLKELTSEIPDLCINYWYIHIPVCHNWLTGWMEPNIHNKLSKKIPSFDINYDTGMVTVKGRDSGYLDDFSVNNVFGYEYYTNYDECDIVEGVWKAITDEKIKENYVHVLEMRFLENFDGRFGIGVVSLFMTFIFEIIKSSETMVILKGRNESESYDTIKAMEIDTVKKGDKLSLIIDYNKEKLTFYFNNKIFCSYLFGIAEKCVYDENIYEENLYWHPLFEFNTNENKKDVSKFEITTCHLQETPDYHCWYEDDTKDDIHEITRCNAFNENYHLLFSVGNNNFGQQGHGDLYNYQNHQCLSCDDNKVLKLMKYFPNNTLIKKISFGYNGTPYFLTKDGDLYVCGINEYLSLGLTSFKDETNKEKNKRMDFKLMEPKKLKLPFKVKNISDGIHTLHRFIMSMDGKIYGIGRNEYNQIGIKSTKREIGRFGSIELKSEFEGVVDEFTIINHFNDKGIKINKIQCGLNFTVFLGQRGNVYFHGIIGLKQFTEPLKVSEIHRIDGIDNIKDVCCTEENIFALNNNGNVYEWNYLNDEHIKSLEMNISITKIKCGYNHCVFLDDNGNIYCKGSNYLGQLGNGDEEENIGDLQINERLKSIYIIDIKCGSDHSMAKTDKNDYYLWGSNVYNQCLVYNDDINKISTPTRYDYDDLKNDIIIIDMYLGWKQTIVVTEIKSNITKTCDDDDDQIEYIE